VWWWRGARHGHDGRGKVGWGGGWGAAGMEHGVAADMARRGIGGTVGMAAVARRSGADEQRDEAVTGEGRGNFLS